MPHRDDELAIASLEVFAGSRRAIKPRESSTRAAKPKRTSKHE